MIAALLGLSVILVTPSLTAAWSANYSVTWINQQSQKYCVVGGTEMMLEPMQPTRPTQNTAYVYGRQHTGCSYSSTDYGLDARAWAWMMYIYSPVGYYYWDASYSSAKDATGQVLRRVGIYGQPQGVEINHGSHAFVMTGGTMSCDPTQSGCLTGSYTITNVWVLDPWGYWSNSPNNCGTSGNPIGCIGLSATSHSYTYISWSAWSAYYYTAFSQSDCNIWTGYYPAVLRTSTAMAPGPVNPSTTNLPPDAPPGSSPVLASGKSETPGTAPTPVPLMHPDDPRPAVVPATPSAALEDAIRKSFAASVSERGLASDPKSSDAFTRAQLDPNLVFVRSTDPQFPDYYLGRVVGAKGFRAIAMWTVNNNVPEFAGFTLYDSPLAGYPFVDAAAARAAAVRAGLTVNGAPALTWTWAQETMSPYYPLWTVPTTAGPVYVEQTGELVSAIHPTD